MDRKIPQAKLELLVDIIWVAFAGWYFVTAQTYPPSARFVPTVFSGVALVVGLFQLSGNFVPALRGLTKGPSQGPEAIQSVPREEQSRQLAAIWWALGYFAGIVLLGFVISTPLFLLAYFYTLNRGNWKLIIIPAAAMGLLTWMVDLYITQLPLGLLFQWLGF